MEKNDEMNCMSKAAELMQELGEAEDKKVDVGSVIQALIDAKPSDDNDAQGKFIQLMRGLAFSDDPKATAFMKKLMGDVDSSYKVGGSTDDDGDDDGSDDEGDDE